MKKINKTLISLGTVAATIAPVVTVLSCGSNSEDGTRKFHILPTYTGEADQLLSLGVHSDYYPLQLNSKAPFDYISNAAKYMTQQSPDFKNKFQERLNNLMPKIQGASWWNQDAKNSDDDRIDNTYWQKQHGDILLYEHYLLDDDQKIIESSWAPGHNNETTIQTNFRASRDPYTRIPKGVFYGWDLSDEQAEKLSKGQSLAVGGEISSTAPAKNETGMWLDGGKLKSKIMGEEVTDAIEITQADAKIIVSLRKVKKDFDEKGTGNGEWVYNDWFFVDFFHRNFLDNEQFQTSHFKDWIIDSTKENPFDDDATIAGQLQALFDASTYRENEVKNGIPHSSTAHGSTVVSHHPIYEQQGGEIGAAPMFEGAMRDNQLYLYNVASQLDNLVTYGTPYGQQHYNSLPKTAPHAEVVGIQKIARSQDEADEIKNWIKNNIPSSQVDEMKLAFDNANQITGELKTRMAAMKDYFQALGLEGKRFGLMTIAPGKGVSTIQTMSKFSFIYKELGFKQPIPSNLHNLAMGAKTFSDGWQTDGSNTFLEDGSVKDTAQDAIKEAVGDGSMFNMDDNGWFWNLGEEGDGTTEGTTLEADKLELFKGTFDLGILATKDTNYDAEIGHNPGIALKVAQLFDENAVSSNAKTILAKARENASYDLWNEGLKTPFVMHMLLDQIVTKAEEYAEAHKSETGINAPSSVPSAKKAAAINWGNYFSNKFIG